MTSESAPKIRPLLDVDLADLLPALRGTVFVATFVLAWVTLKPFSSLGTRASLGLSSGTETATYAAFGGLAMAAMALLGPRMRHLSCCMRPLPVIAMGIWLCVTSVVSQDPSTSLRRLALAGILALLAACLFLIPRTPRDLACLLAIATGMLLALSYAGVLLAPELAIHQATDIGEPQLAGDWRGVFAHKNGAAAMFSLCVFFGLYILRRGSPVIGGLIVILCVTFLLFAGGKTALMLVGVSALAGMAWEVCRGRTLRIAAAILPAVFLNLVGVGSVLVPSIGAFTAGLPVDTTFTGRTDIWAFAADSIQGHLATGYGFQAFWNTAAIRFGTTDEGWAGQAAHAHNGYLDLVIGMGLPGLVLGIALFVLMPMRDRFAAERRGADPAVLAMLTQVWLFGISFSSMETFLFNRADPVWLTFLFAIMGLRMAATHALRRDDAP